MLTPRVSACERMVRVRVRVYSHASAGVLASTMRDASRDTTVAKSPKHATPGSSEPEPELGRAPEQAPVSEPRIQAGPAESTAGDSDVPAELTREVTLGSHPTRIRLDQIDRTTLKQVYCHRDEKELVSGTAMEALVESIVSEGQITPVEFYRDSAGQAILIQGYRIVEAHYQILGRQLDPDHFSEDMEIPAVEISGGAEVDYLLRAIASNEVRANLSEEAKYTVAVLLLERKVSSTRAARAMGISTTQFRRYIKRWHNQWILPYVKADYISISEADLYLEEAGKTNAYKLLQTGLERVYGQVKDHIVRKQEQAKVTKEKLPKAVVSGKTYLKAAKVKQQVLDALKEQKPINVKLNLDTGVGTTTTKDSTFEFECKLDEKDGKLKITGLNGKTLNSLTYADLGAISFKLNTLAEEVTACFDMKMAVLSTAEVKQRDRLRAHIDFYRQRGATDLAAQLEAQIAPATGNGKGNGNGAGARGTSNPVPAQRKETPVAANINVPPQSKT